MRFNSVNAKLIEHNNVMNMTLSVEIKNATKLTNKYDIKFIGSQ